MFRFRNGAERTFTGRSLLLTFSVPQFFFHVTTAYDILRHCGVDIAKKDFLGNASAELRATGPSGCYFGCRLRGPDWPRRFVRPFRS